MNLRRILSRRITGQIYFLENRNNLYKSRSLNNLIIILRVSTKPSNFSMKPSHTFLSELELRHSMWVEYLDHIRYRLACQSSHRNRVDLVKPEIANWIHSVRVSLFLFYALNTGPALFPMFLRRTDFFELFSNSLKTFSCFLSRGRLN